MLSFFLITDLSHISTTSSKNIKQIPPVFAGPLVALKLQGIMDLLRKGRKETRHKIRGLEPGQGRMFVMSFFCILIKMRPLYKLRRVSWYFFSN